jgi:chromosome segregation ATPase
VALAGLRQEAEKSKRQLEDQNTRLQEILEREKKHAEEIKLQLERARAAEAAAKAKIDEAQRQTEALQAKLAKVGADKEEEEKRAQEALQRIADERKAALGLSNFTTPLAK